jgi:hypothetical protein
MQVKTGVWIDHKDAFIVFDGVVAPKSASGVEKHVRFTGHAASHEGSADDKRERQHAAHLGTYYDEVISHLHDAESIYLFGPGEAKGELEKRLAAKGFAQRIVGVEAADRMTDHQIVAKVRQHYEK